MVIAENNAVAASVDPTQSIGYWKTYTISAEQDEKVAHAHNVFSTLLRSWDSSRVAPGLYVVSSTTGPWAASLADGNILLSYDAITSTLEFGKKRAKHLLAFVLAHELAHQRADDLWHKKFFRMAGNKSSELKRQMFRGLNLNESNINDLQRREAQADNDGLVMMTIVGYDPYQVIDKKDFFTAWVENIWKESCDINNTKSTQACQQARSRALRTHAQLVSIADQATLFELGTQAFISGNYIEARRYFEAFGRDFPSRALHSNIGLTYLTQAINEHQQLTTRNLIDTPDFFYPMILDSSPKATPVEEQSSNKRGIDILSKNKLQLISQYTQKAIKHFEKAIRLEPDHRETHIYLAMSYLLNSNTFMARGILQGTFLPRFGQDAAAELLIAMTSAIEGNYQKSVSEFEKILDQVNNIRKSKDTESLSRDLVIYSVFYNYAALLEHKNKTKKTKQRDLWKQLAKHAKNNKNSTLFSLAVNHINPGVNSHQQTINHPLINQLRPGDSITTKMKEMLFTSDIWLEGEQLNVYHFDNGTRIVANQNNKVISAWQTDTRKSSDPDTNIGNITLGDKADRALKSLGIPDKRISMVTGEYFAYNNIGLALHIVNNTITGWFLYDPA